MKIARSNSLDKIVYSLKKNKNKVISIILMVFLLQIGFSFGPIGGSVKASNNTQNIAVTVTDYYTGDLIDGVTITFDHRGNKSADDSTPVSKGRYTVQCDPNGMNDVTVSMSTDIYSDYVTSCDNYVKSYALNAGKAFSYVVNPNNTTLGIKLIRKSGFTGIGSGVNINVTDSSNQSIPQYTNSPGKTTNTIFSNPVRLAVGATAKISYGLYDVTFSKYKFIQASDLNTIPQFPVDSAMNNIDLPLPNTYEAYKDDIGKQNYLTTKHYEYAGNADVQNLSRDVSFGTPVFSGVYEQEAVTDTTKNPIKYDLGSTDGSNFYVGKRGDESDNWKVYGNAQSTSGTNTIKYNGKYYPKYKYAAWKAMKMWGYFSPQKSGNYSLGAFADDGAYGYLMVNGEQKVFVSDWTLHAPVDKPLSNLTSIYLKGADSGTRYYYPIYMEWYEGRPTQGAFVPEYKFNNGAFTAIPESELFSSKTTTPGDVASAYFGDVSGIDFPAQDGIYYVATKFVSSEGTTKGLYGPFIIDNTKPTISNLNVISNNVNDNKLAVSANTLTIRFTVSETLSSNPQILIDGHPADATITKDSQNNYTATVNIGSNGSINSNGDTVTNGPITVQVAHYSDLSGNEGDAVQDSSVTYDSIAPSVAITYSANPIGVGTEVITATYSEPVKAGETPQISINQQGSTNITAQNMTAIGTDRKVWCYDYTVNKDNGINYKDGTATVSLSTTHDAAGNTATAPTGNTFTINTKAPTVTLSFSSNPTSVGTETITATYSNPIKSGEVPKISIDQQGTSDVVVQNMTKVGTDAITWTYDYTVHNATADSRYKDGTATVSLSTVHDALGNPASAPQANTFVIDTKSPSVAITYSANPAKAGSEIITATYSEPIRDGDIPKISINQQGTVDTTQENMTASGRDRTTWTYTYTVNQDNGSTYQDGTATVSLSSVHDAAGNAASNPTGSTFTIDTIAPTVTIGTPSMNITDAGPVTYQVTYSGADSITLNSSNVTLVKTGTADGTVTADGTGNTRTITVSEISGNGTLAIKIAAATASDNAGNTSVAPPDSETFSVVNTPNSILKQGMYESNNSDNEYISTSNNNKFDVVKNLPVTVAMIVDIKTPSPKILLKIEGNLKNSSISFNKYEISKNSTTNKYLIKSGTNLQSYTASSYLSDITFTNNVNNSNFSLEKGKQYIIFYSITPNGKKGDKITISADIDKEAVDSNNAASKIELDVEDLPSVQ